MAGRTCELTGSATGELTGSSVAVLRDFLPLFLCFPAVGAGETGVDVTFKLKMGSPSSSNKKPVFTMQSRYLLIGLPFAAKFWSVHFNGLSGVDRSCSKCAKSSCFILNWL